MTVFISEERTILGPLTTVFTAPASCSVAHGICANCDIAWVGQTCAPTTVEDNPACWPPTSTGAPTGGAFMYGWGFYSPAVGCPAGHVEACRATAGGSKDWDHQYLMEPEETFVGCCPSGFRCHNENGQTCISEATSTSFATVSCSSGTSNNFGYMTVPQTDVPSVTIYAPMIQLAWKPTDASLRRSWATTTTLPTPPKSISAGAIAGIVVGSTALLIGILVATFFIWKTKRSADPRYGSGSIESQRSSPPGYTSQTGPEIAELKNHTTIYTAHAESPEPSELRSSHGSRIMMPVELGSDGPVELPGPELSPRELMHRRMFEEGAENEEEMKEDERKEDDRKEDEKMEEEKEDKNQDEKGVK